MNRVLVEYKLKNLFSNNDSVETHYIWVLCSNTENTQLEIEQRVEKYIFNLPNNNHFFALVKGSIKKVPTI